MDQDGTCHGGRPQPRRLCVRWGPSPHPPQKGGGAHLPKFPPISIAVKGLDISRCHLVWRYPSSLWTLCSMRTQPPPEKGGGTPQCSVHVYCGQTAAWITMPLGTEVGLSQGDFVSDGDPAPLPKRGRSFHPQFSAHVHCGQTAGWIKMALGMEVDLGPRHIVLDEPPPNFWPIFIVAKRLDASRCHLVWR